MIKVSKIKWLDGHRLQFVFSDGSIGDYDFAPVVGGPGPMVAPLRDLAFFKRVFLEFGAPTWPNGFDVAPEWLHRELASAGKLVRPATA